MTYHHPSAFWRVFVVPRAITGDNKKEDDNDDNDDDDDGLSWMYKNDDTDPTYVYWSSCNPKECDMNVRGEHGRNVVLFRGKVWTIVQVELPDYSPDPDCDYEELEFTTVHYLLRTLNERPKAVVPHPKYKPEYGKCPKCKTECDAEDELCDDCDPAVI